MIRPKFVAAATLAFVGTLVWAQGSFITIDVPGAASTGSAVGRVRLKMNSQGQIVGGYSDTLGKEHGFLLSNGNFTNIDYPGAIFTTLCDISPSGDTLLGIYQDANFILHGFLLSQGNLSTIDVGGVFVDSSGRFHGWVLSGGIFTQIDFPGSTFTSVQAVIAGRILGVEISGGTAHGYLLVNGAFTQIDVPGAVFTAPIDVNQEGTIVGEYFTPD